MNDRSHGEPAITPDPESNPMIGANAVAVCAPAEPSSGLHPQGSDVPSAQSASSGEADEVSAAQAELDIMSLAFDPLLFSLKSILRFYGFPNADAVLKSELHPEARQMLPRDVVKICTKLGFRARVVKKRANKITSADCPAIAFKNDDQAVVLRGVEGGQIWFQNPETLAEDVALGVRDFDKEYSGFLLLIRPDTGLQVERYAKTELRQKSWFWSPIFSNWWYFFQVALASVATNLFALVSPLFIMIVYDRVIPNQSLSTLWVLVTGMAIIFGFDFVLKTLRSRFVDIAAKRADIIIGERLFEQLLTVQMSARPQSAGSFGSTLREFESLREFFSSATLLALIDLPFCFLFLGVLWVISGDVATVLFLAVPIVIAYSVIVQLPLHLSTKRYMRESHAKHGILIETIHCLEVMRAIGAERRMRQVWRDSVSAAATSSERTKIWSASTTNVTGMVQQATSVGVVLFGVHMIIEQQLTMGGLIACVMLGGRALTPLAQVAGILTRFHQSRTALKALNEFMEQPTERPADRNFITKPVLDGSIVLKDVSFRYGEESDLALNKVSLTINPGEHVGIVGRIGSGKSTLAKLILGLHSPTEGQIQVGGIDLRQLDPSDLRANIGYVPQDVMLFKGSVRENITASAVDADDATILRVADEAGLSDFLNSNSAGLDYPIGESGDGLSGGQRQSLTIARALIRDPSILLWDEPTSAMDSRSEKQLTDRIKAVSNVRTLVLITHRSSLLRSVDRLIVLDKGTIVADGPRDVVIAHLKDGTVRGGA